ncbi:MAG: STAS domain-containing protein [Parvibaculaceae bacterium]
MTDAAQLKSIKLAGRLDTARVGEVETGFYAEVGFIKDPSAVALIDLTDVTFLSSLGIRLLVTAGKTFTQRQIRFGLIASQSEDVMEALEISGITGLFRIFKNEEEARSDF